MGKICVVTGPEGAENVVKRITLGEPIVGLAGTGARVGPKGKLCLVVLTTSKGDVFAFDIKKHPDIMYQGLGRLLQSNHVLKVIHGSGPMAANLLAQFGISLQNIFDTQVAYSVVMEKQGLCPRKVLLSALCEKCSIDQYTPSPQLQKLLAEDENAWARRPLNPDMLNTAAASALPLVPTLYKQLLGVIEKDSWDWFCTLNDRERLSLIGPKRARSGKTKEGKVPSQLPVFRLSASKGAAVTPAAQTA